MAVSILSAEHPDLVAYYTMSNIVGSTLVDETGNYPGVIVGATQVADGTGHALDFNGSAGYVKVPIAAGSPLDAPAAMAVEIEFTLRDTADECLFSRYAASNLDTQMYIAPGNGFVWRKANTAASVAAAIPGLSKTHAVGQYNGAVWEIFVEGQKVAEAGSTLKMASNAEPLLIGTDADATNAGSLGNWLNGKINKIRFFKRTLTPAEIVELYEERLPYTVAGTILQDAVPLAAQARIYDAATGELVDTVVSDSSGVYQKNLPTAADVYVMVVPNSGYRPLIHGPINPALRYP
ncbi:LamG domain-containing protein [Marinobacterium rhizophilum]|uniref:Concanavalin A-like lectin/glucanase superfamily protein n=1 Tax=Marinobacterium rhizophilum TaxID=420402 RepID=A0ABY5HKL0_9GAMM|nr:LamG domain-containing protein [Marinobacterium rhizophilum]UTW12928.1 hypothetical protein KDW95_04440 [Marinobacterium rhizophilum]